MGINKVTQEDLSSVVGVGRSAIGSYVRGEAEPNIDKQIVIAEFFGISVDELLRVDLLVPQTESSYVVREPQSTYSVSKNGKVDQLQALISENEILHKHIVLLEKHVTLQEEMIKKLQE